MNVLSRLSRLLITAVMMGALLQVASFSYRVSTAASAEASAHPIDLALPKRRNDAAHFALIRAMAEQYGITVADRTTPWSLDEVSSLKRGLDQIADRLSELTRRDGQRVQNVAAYSHENGVYHLGRTYPLRDPRDQPRHRSDSAAEDWAESFATVVVPAFEAKLRDIGEAREREVRRFITQWVARTFGEHQFQRRGMRP